MRGLIAAALVLTLSACAGPLMSERRPVPPPIGPVATFDLSKRGAGARQFAEYVSARCLLDGVLRGAAMVVDKASGRVLIVGETQRLLAIDVIPSGRSSRLRLSGPAVADPATRQQMLYHLDRAARTGDTACPMLAVHPNLQAAM